MELWISDEGQNESIAVRSFSSPFAIIYSGAGYLCVNAILVKSVYLVDPASSHTLVLKIKPCMSKCFDCLTLDCRRLIITVIV